MTRSRAVRFLRTEPTMAFPEGRLLAVADGRSHVLAPDGWVVLGRVIPVGATEMSREDAEDWCEGEGWDPHLLDEVPRTSSGP